MLLEETPANSPSDSMAGVLETVWMVANLQFPGLSSPHRKVMSHAISAAIAGGERHFGTLQRIGLNALVSELERPATVTVAVIVPQTRLPQTLDWHSNWSQSACL